LKILLSTKKKTGLEQFYIGDEAFLRYVDACRELVGRDWEQWTARTTLCEVCHGDASIGVAIFALAGERSVEWMDLEVPVLEGLTPRECLKTGWGRDRLKEALLRSP
jgi:hypothetical protein